MKFELSKTIEILERTPRILEAMLSSLSPEWTEVNEGGETFSAKDVVAHLLHGEETDWIPRAQIILNEGTTKPFTPFDRLAFREKYRAYSLDGLLREFGDARAKSLQSLEAMQLDEIALTKVGQHPELGRVTLRQLLATWTVHDLGHLRQVSRVLAKQYQSQVGPWTQYLRVLHE